MRIEIKALVWKARNFVDADIAPPQSLLRDANMKTFRKILAPTDFSDLSRHAIALASEQASFHGAELHLFHSLVPGMVAHSPENGSTGAATHDVLSGVQQNLLCFPEGAEQSNDPSRPGLKVVRIVQLGNPRQQIVDYARQNGIDLIVLAPHARSSLGRFLLGSTTEAVVRHAPCPLLIVPAPGLEDN